jgi:hypothetical protein
MKPTGTATPHHKTITPEVKTTLHHLRMVQEVELRNPITLFSA